MGGGGWGLSWKFIAHRTLSRGYRQDGTSVIFFVEVWGETPLNVRVRTWGWQGLLQSPPGLSKTLCSFIRTHRHFFLSWNNVFLNLFLSTKKQYRLTVKALETQRNIKVNKKRWGWHQRVAGGALRHNYQQHSRSHCGGTRNLQKNSAFSIRAMCRVKTNLPTSLFYFWCIF